MGWETTLPGPPTSPCLQGGSRTPPLLERARRHRSSFDALGAGRGSAATRPNADLLSSWSSRWSSYHELGLAYARRGICRSNVARMSFDRISPQSWRDGRRSLETPRFRWSDWTAFPSGSTGFGQCVRPGLRLYRSAGPPRGTRTRLRLGRTGTPGLSLERCVGWRPPAAGVPAWCGCRRRSLARGRS